MDAGNRRDTVPDILERIERARRRPRLLEKAITMAHGAGGKATRALVDRVFLEALGNPVLDALEDAASLEVGGVRLALTTDAFTVHPPFFPGGDIGCLAVHGTVNDLASAGARPLYIAAAFVLEEGFPIEDLRRIVASMASAAREAGVQVVAGDTKVVQRGKGDGIYIAAAGIGIIERPIHLGADQVRPGDRILVSGPVGDHGVAVMVARGDLDLEIDLQSDTAPLWSLVERLLDAAPGVHCLRDATRGGVATVLNEIALAAQVGIRVWEARVPVRPEVRGACEILGIDPLYVANEGKLVAFVAPEDAPAALAAMREHPLGREAAEIGVVEAEPAGTVLLETEIGGVRVLDMLAGDPLPRIC